MLQTRLYRPAFALAGCVVTVALAPSANAQSTTGTMTVSTTVASSCAVSNVSNVSFGTFAGQSVPQTDTTGSFDVTCTTGTAYSIALDRGVNVSGTTRRMKAGTSNYLSYELYSDSGRTSIWSTAISGFTGTNSAQSRQVYARLSSQSAPAPGTYTDTVTITVAF